MAYGFEVYDGNGNTRLSVSDTFTRVLYSISVGQNSSGSKYLEDFDPSKGAVFSIPIDGNYSNFLNGKIGIGHYTSYTASGSGYDISWKPDGFEPAESLIMVIMYG